MDLSATDRENNSVRHLVNQLLRFDLFDAKWETSFGLTQIMRGNGTTVFGNQKRANGLVLASLVQVVMEMIPWFEWDSRLWNELAIVDLTCMNAADFLLTPLLNKYQTVQTIFTNLVMEAQYFNWDRLVDFLRDRGGSIEWIPTEEEGIKFAQHLHDAAKRTSNKQINGKAIKKQKRDLFIARQDDKTELDNSELEPNSPSPTLLTFAGCIYMKIFETGHVYGGKFNDLCPNRHQECCCSFCIFRQQNSKLKYIQAVVYLVEEKNELDLYEGIFHFLLKMAELKGMQLRDLQLPFTLKPIDYEKTWPGFDPSISLPVVPIKVINHFVNAQALTWKHLDDMINIAKVLFKIDLGIKYDYSRDPLNYTKNK